MVNEEFVLRRDCAATLIPAGDAVVLRKGSSVLVTQALGGSVTVRDALGLFRISSADLDALGERVQEWAQEQAGGAEPAASGGIFSEDGVWGALRHCYDPEIPVNIVDLGLIYDLRVEPSADGRSKVFVKMTLTAPGCGMGPVIADDARGRIEALPGVESAKVEIVWDPPWNPHMISA
ncbi:MAG: iron-sulfur cluster assembly protein, partial [Opitutales bacterium]